MITSNPDWDNQINTASNYFEDSYIGGPGRHGPCRAPLISIGLWYMYDRALNGQAPTNNAIEAWHSGFAALKGAKYSNFWETP